MKIAIGSDHGGFELKEVIKSFLQERGYELKDFGTNSNESCDYPDYAFQVAQAVVKGQFERGILICGTGIGMSMAANKVKGIRASLCHDVYTAKMGREHNDANILTLGARVLKKQLALDILETWLTTSFTNDRHQRRLNKIAEYEKK
ncbi:MAG: ribose 5-phosphate isomerase B [Candidatus Margulisbacteria bacterium]|nr:ribose 5-phosphate isomerase B [Candidatus Margulisiibacteriota bacterium]